MDELIRFLSQGDHPVEVSLRPEKTAPALKSRLEEFAFVHLKFTGTRGGTELGVKVDPERSEWKNADFDRAEGRIRLAGSLNLNYTPVTCVAEIDLATLSGVGHLEIAASESSEV